MLRQESVDVIIPTYNRAKVLRDSIMSVLRQTYSNLNLFVVDDASDDNTAEIVSGIHDERLHYVRLEQRRGSNYCRNVGARQGDSAYIAFNDSDDLWNENKLELQVYYMRDKAPGLLFSPYILRGESNEKVIGKCTASDVANMQKTLVAGNVVGTPTIFLDRVVFETVGGFDTDLPRIQDWEFALRVSRSYPIFYIDEPLVRAQGGGNRISTDTDALNKATRIFSQRNADLIVKYGKVMQYMYMCHNSGMTDDEIFELFFPDSVISPNDNEKMMFRECIKYRYYYLTLCDVIEKNTDILGFFDHKMINSVAIYGCTRLSKILAQIVYEGGIGIVAMIDQNTHKECSFHLVTPDEYRDDINKAKCIVNTVPALHGRLHNQFPEEEIVELEEILENK